MSSTEEDPDFEFELDWNDDVGSTTVVDGPPPPILQHISPQHNKAPQQENIIPRYTAGPPDLTPPGLARTPPGLARTPPGLAHPSSGYARPPLGIPGPSGTQIQAEPSNRALTSSRQSGLSNQRASYPSGPLVVAGPSGLQRQTHPKPPNLVDIDTDATDDMIQTDNSRAIVRAKDNNGVNRKIPQGLKYQPASFGGYIGDDDDSPQPNQGAFSLPNIPRREDRYEEEDEYFGEHPTGFRRANEADVAERNGEPPNANFSLPTRRHPEFDVRFFGPRNNNVSHIARKTGTHISMPTDIDEPVLQMWGTPNQLQAARQDLHALLEHVQIEIQAGIRRVGGWVKIKAMPTDTRQMMIDKMINDSKIRKMYRRPPPEGMAFPAVGLFVWPVKELNPQVSLGMTLEALDDIRFEEEVFIIYSRNRNLFRVLGEKNTNVESAVERIYGAFCEVATKNRKPTKMCLVSPPSIRLPAIKVYVDENHDLINRQVTVKRIDENKGIQVFLGGPRPNHRFLEIWRIKGEILRKANLEYLRKALQQGLLDVAYYRGQARLKVYIGKLVLFGYRRASLKDGTYELQDFSEMVRNPQTDGEVIRSIGSTKYNIRDNETAEALVEYLGDRYDLFPAKDHSPDSPHGQTRSLEPHISATFDLRLYDQASSEDIRLEVEFERLPKMKTYKAVNFRWLETERKGKENCRKSPLDVKIMDLEANLAYQIDMSTWALYEGVSIYPIFQEFRRRLSVEEIPDEFCGLPPPPPGRADDRPRVLRVSFVNLPGLSVGGLVQKTKFRYWMGNTDYVFEITKYENLPIHEVSSLYPDSVPISYKGLETPFDTRWGCGLWNSGWDEKLSKQASAKIGTRGNWEPDVDKFFLPTAAGKLNACGGVWGDDGVAEFVGRIEEAVELVKRAQENAALKKQKTNPYASMVDAALLSRMYTATSGSEAEQWIGSAEFDE